MDNKLSKIKITINDTLQNITLKEDLKNETLKQAKTAYTKFSYIRRIILAASFLVFISSSIFLGIHFMDTSNKSSSGIIIYQSNEQLAKDSDVIVKGKVKELLPSKRENFVNKDGYNLDITYTDVVFEIDDTIKGIPYDKIIHVRINKGRVGFHVVNNNNIPDFIKDEECLLFLNNDTTSYKVEGDNHYFINGTIQGKFVLNSTNGEYETLAPDHGNINLADLKKQIELGM